MTVYVKLLEPWHCVPLLSQDSIDEYKRLNIDPHKGTSYGEVERTHHAELKLAAKLGCELLKLDKHEFLEVSL